MNLVPFWGMVVLAFSLTVAEAWVAIRRTQSIVSRNALHVANWDALFEAMLFVDLVLIIESRWLVLPILAGAWIGSYCSIRFYKGVA